MLGGGQSVPLRPSLNLSDLADAPTARNNLGVDVAGTDNSTPVTLAGSLDYLTLSGQQITRGAIDLTTDVSGALPVANGGTGATTAANAATALGLGIGSAVQHASLDLTGITDGRIPYMGASGFADTPLQANASNIGLTDGVLRAVQAFGTSASPGRTRLIDGGNNTLAGSVTSPAHICLLNEFTSNNKNYFGIVTRNSSAAQIDNTVFLADGGQQQAKATADPTGVADTIQIYCASSTGYAMVREGAGTARRIAPLIQLAATTTYYVRSDGSDSNNGLADTSGGAFATLQGALNYLARNVNAAAYATTIQVRDATYTSATTLPFINGLGALTIQGNSSTPANSLISTTSANCFTSAGVPYVVTIKDMKLTTTTSGSCIDITNTVLNFSNIDFGAAAEYHVWSQAGSSVFVTGNYSITGGAVLHLGAYGNGGYVQCTSRTVTLTGTPAITEGFAYADRGGVIIVTGNTFSGSATGKRYFAGHGATINSGGATLPGNAAGTTSGNGAYY